MKLLLKLWFQFFKFAGRCYLHRRRPLFIEPAEILGRELFSKKQFSVSAKRIKLNAFQPPKGKREISVSRLSLISRYLAIAIAENHAKAGRGTFYGFAKIPNHQIKKVGATSGGRPMFENPFHANIQLPPDEGKSFILNVARQLAERAQFVPR